MKKLIVANWKMNKNAKEAVSFAKELKRLVKGNNAEIVICPSFALLSAVANELKGSSIKLGAQNMHFQESGAFTGEVSPLMLKDLGCEYVILGHSERREHFKESDELINKKVLSALKNGLKPILCIGESLEEKKNDLTDDVLEDQLLKCLSNAGSIKNVIIAYEPVWAISKGDPNKKSATKVDAEEAHLFIRQVLNGIYGEDAKEARIIYGGSMKPENAKELLEMRNINGGLVGNASLDVKSFIEIIKACC